MSTVILPPSSILLGVSAITHYIEGAKTVPLVFLPVTFIDGICSLPQLCSFACGGAMVKAQTATGTGTTGPET
jgi:hypothetical protein